MIQPLNPDVERTEVIRGSERVIGTELHFFSEAKNRIDTCMDDTRPTLAIGIEPIRKSFVEAKSKGVQLRYLTEITNDNLSSCKEIMKIVDELRHLDGTKGNFMISESEYLAPITSDEKAQPATIIIFSNVLTIALVEHQQYVFDTFWHKAIPAEQRITEIEGVDRTVLKLSQIQIEHENDIFDATKIESKSLELKKERFNLKKIGFGDVEEHVR